MSVIDKIDMILNEGDGYWKVGVGDKKGGSIKVVEVVSSKSQVSKARKSHSKSDNMIYVQKASKKDYSDYSNGKTIKWTQSVSEDVYDAEAIVGKKRITKPMSAKSEKDAEKQFEDFLKGQMKYGHIPKGTIKNIKVKKA